MLPMDRRLFGLRTKKTLMFAHEAIMNQFKALVKDFPESIDITICGKSCIRKVQSIPA